MKKYSKDIQDLLKKVIDECEGEDRTVRESQIRSWKELKLFWEGFSRVWYSETAHDWRIATESEDTDQSAYDKPINVFRAYLESIIAALSVSIPPIKCFPDDADNTLDLATAKAGDKISQLIYRHNDVHLLWLHALFIYCTEGMTACYNYSKSDKSYGTYEEKEYSEEEEEQEVTTCPNCHTVFNAEQVQPNEFEFDPGLPEPEICPECLQLGIPEVKREKFVVTRLIGITNQPKSRVCLEVYGGLHVQVPNYAKNQEQCPYLIFSEEINYTTAVERWDHLSGTADLTKKIRNSGGDVGGSYDQTEQWGRLSSEYSGEYPTNVITIKHCWLRKSTFNFLHEDEAKKLKAKFPDGVRVVLANGLFAEAENESLDDHWTLSYNPLSDHVYHNPLGRLLTSIQDITNDLTSLVLQTIEHGIGQTFADPGVLSFKDYNKTEVVPGGIFPAIPKSGKSLQEGFHELRTATLSAEVLPFANNIQSMAQLVSGALPSLFGGALAGSETASQYSMSRAQALQRLQSTYKIYTSWWKNIFGKVIPMYIKNVKDDERNVEQDADGNFVNTFIRKSELEGKIGRIELEAAENLPLTWAQINDIVMKLLENQNPEVIKIISAPENIPILHRALGLTDFYVPGEDDVIKQYDEIKLLLNSEPIPQPPDPMMVQQALMAGLPPPPEIELPSIEIDPIIDNNPLEFEICRKWAISEAGRQAKTDNPNGYRNVLLHAKMHHEQMQMQMMQQQQQMAPPEKAGPSLETPITGEGDVTTIQ